MRLQWWHLSPAGLGLAVVNRAGQLTWPAAAVLIAIIVAILIFFLMALLRVEALPKIRRDGKYRFTIQWERMRIAERDQAKHSEDKK